MKQLATWILILGIALIDVGAAVAALGCPAMGAAEASCCCGPDSACSVPDATSGISDACCEMSGETPIAPVTPAAAQAPGTQGAIAVIGLTVAAVQTPATTSSVSRHVATKAPPPPAYTLFCTWLN